MSAKFVIRLAAGVAAVSLAACGSSSKTAEPTKAEYLTKANAICRAMNTQLAQIPPPGNDPVQAASSADRAIAITKPVLRALRALAAPTGDAQALAAIYQKVDVLVADYAAFSGAAHAGNLPALGPAGAQIDADSRVANAASNAYGMTVCGTA